MLQQDDLPGNLRRNPYGDVVVTAVNDHPDYLTALPWWFAFWKLASKDWPGLLTPVALKFGTPIDSKFAHHENVVHYKLPDGLSGTFASQVSRVIWPAFAPSTLGAVITSDVDMMPLSAQPLGAVSLASSVGITITRNVLQSRNQYPICYVAARPDAWREVVNPEPSLAETLRRVSLQYGSHAGHRGGPGWDIDQRFLFDSVSAYTERGGTVALLSDNETGYRRIGREQRKLFVLAAAALSRWARWSSYHSHLPAADDDRVLRLFYRNFEARIRS